MCEWLDLVGHDSDRESHEGHATDTTAAVLSKEVPGTPILYRVLIRDQLVEEIDDLVATPLEVFHIDDKDEVIAADVPDEATWCQPPNHVAENAGQQEDDVVAMIVP